MTWEDEGFIVSKNKFRENAIIIEVFTKRYGKVSGIVYGGNSRKIKNFLQLGNKIYVVYNSKSENRIGYFKTELIQPISPKYFNNKKKILCLNSVSSILKVLLPENQSNIKIYNSLNALLNNFNKENWLIEYLKWELNLINNLGFGFYPTYQSIPINDIQQSYDIKIDNIDYKIPHFLVAKNVGSVSDTDIYMGLSFTRNLMENKFFSINNLKFPYSRKLFEKFFL